MNASDQYINNFPEPTKLIPISIRYIIMTEAPYAEEHFSYGIPAYKLCGKPMVYFTAFQKHIGFYITTSGHSAFLDKLLSYKRGKGSVQLPIDEPISYDLIRRKILLRKAENEAKCGKKRRVD